MVILHAFNYTIVTIQPINTKTVENESYLLAPERRLF